MYTACFPYNTDMTQKLIKYSLASLATLTAATIFTCRYYSFTPVKRIPGTPLSNPLSSPAGDTPVIYEAVFLDEEEVQEIFAEIRGNPEFAKTPRDYHMTTLYYPDEPATDLYGTKVRLHVTGYQSERFLDEKLHITGAEGLRVQLECDDPEFQEYFSQFNAQWHVTGSYMTEPVYTGLLNYRKAKPIDYTIDGVFGAYCTGDHYCYDAACPVGLENRRVFN